MSLKAKKKICPTCGEEKYLWNKKVGCKECVAKSKKQLGGNKAKLKRKPLSPISDKRKKQQAAYRVLREAYLKEHKVCEICGTPNPTDIHHKGGRMEDKLNDFTNVMALCRPCHQRIHFESPQWARDNGYLN